MSSNSPKDFPYSSNQLEEELKHAAEEKRTQLQILNDAHTVTMQQYPYKDHYQHEQEQQQQHEHEKQQHRSQKQQLSEWKPEHFPHKMYDLLDAVERKGLDSIVSWLPDGKCFKIHNQASFERNIMPLYFSGMGSYKSFRRQLNLYGIYQHRHRPNQDANAYSHEFLTRGCRSLCDYIVRKKTNPTKSNIGKKGKKSSSSSSNSRSGSPTADVVLSAKSMDSNGPKNISKRDTSLVRNMIEERNHMHAVATSNSSVNSKATTTRLHPGLENEKLFIEQQLYHQQLLLREDTESNITTSSSLANDLIRQNMLMKSIYDDESSTRPNPIDYSSIKMKTEDKNGGNISSSTDDDVTKREDQNCNNDSTNNDVFQSFMGQYWEDLPDDLSSSQVADEIIATFQQQL